MSGSAASNRFPHRDRIGPASGLVPAGTSAGSGQRARRNHEAEADFGVALSTVTPPAAVPLPHSVVRSAEARAAEADAVTVMLLSSPVVWAHDISGIAGPARADCRSLPEPATPAQRSARPRLTVMKSLDRKLAAVLAGTYTPHDFLIADAKDADMAWGAQAPGPAGGRTDGRTARAGQGFRTRPEYLADMAALVQQGEIDILLASASNGERLAQGGILDDGQVTLAVRANDTTDIWFPRGSGYAEHPSRPFRSADLELVRPFCDLVLYSITFNNDLHHDVATLEAYAEFRADALRHGIRHFLEVFNPNAPVDLAPEQVGPFVNDCIVRALAGVTAQERPLFLKVAYNGPEALEELTGHDPGLVVGILGGSAGTTRDTFELLRAAERHGARVALFGRKIQRAESQLDLVALMRPVLRGDLTPADAVREYHRLLTGKGLSPTRILDEDLQITEPILRQD
jgi:hypothetical protein